MTGPVFVDTNVLAYSFDSTEPSKQERAEQWLKELWATRSGRVSSQVLQEFYVTVTRKLRPGMAAVDARGVVRSLFAWQPLAVEGAVLEAAWVVEDRFSVSWWDALVVAAAQRMGCHVVLSEDFQAGQRFDDVIVVNPFREAPSE